MTGAPTPTSERLAGQLVDLGLSAGRDVLVHCSMRQLGLTTDGPRTVYRALRTVIGPSASVVVPTLTADNSLTSPAFRRATSRLTDDERARYVARMPGFHVRRTPSSGMGVFAEYVRRRPRSRRSRHPQTSFAAVGGSAARIVGVHDLDCHLGWRSPLGQLYRGDAMVLLLGVGFEVCTALHLAEYEVSWLPRRQYQCYVQRRWRRMMLTHEDVDLDDSDFAVIGEVLEKRSFVHRGPFAAARVTAFPLRSAVDCAARWMNDHRVPAS